MNNVETRECRVSSVEGRLELGCAGRLSAAMDRRAVRSLSPRPSPLGRGRACRAFTLIELLVVIAIMAVLAALIIPITGAVNKAKLRSRTRAELRAIETAIIDYKTKRGYYPPDNNTNYILNQLYYELSGTTHQTVGSKDVYTTLDGAGVLDTSQASSFYFGPGFKAIVNTTKGGGGDEGMAAQKFIRDLKPAQVASLNTSPPIKILVASVGWEGPTPLVQPAPTGVAPQGQTKLDPIRYVSTNPVNNPNSFDLWVDIIIAGKTNRICNWSEDPIVLQ
jgi:prepilin-type N-terminal cleavage/methylation domain-containing protein